MPDTDGDRRSSLAAPPDQEAASRLAVLGSLALVAGVVLGVFAAIVVLVAGLALLAMTAAARVNRTRPAGSRRRAPSTGDAVRRTNVPRATH